MLQFSLQDLLVNGRLGGAALGMTRDQVRSCLGAPDDWSANAGGVERASIWRYGNFELHFGPDACCWLIFNDYGSEGFDAGPDRSLDPWCFADRPDRATAAARLRAADLEVDDAIEGEALCLRVGRATLSFTQDVLAIIQVASEHRAYRAKPAAFVEAAVTAPGFDWNAFERLAPDEADERVEDLLARIDGEESGVDVLNRLIGHPGHRRHQAVLRAIQRIGDQRSVPFLRDTLAHGFAVYDYTASDAAVIAKWFSWALHDIGGASARAAVEEFATSKNPEVAGEMSYRLSRWRDKLTGLPTHVVFRSIELPEQGQRAIAFDVAGLLWINDQLGFQQGDTTLSAIARMLSALASEHGGRMFRYAGDEFLWLLDDYRALDSHAVARLALTRCAALNLPFRAVGFERDRVLLNAVLLDLRPGDLDPYALHKRVEEGLSAAKEREGASADLIVEASRQP